MLTQVPCLQAGRYVVVSRDYIQGSEVRVFVVAHTLNMQAYVTWPPQGSSVRVNLYNGKFTYKLLHCWSCVGTLVYFTCQCINCLYKQQRMSWYISLWSILLGKKLKCVPRMASSSWAFLNLLFTSQRNTLGTISTPSFSLMGTASKLSQTHLYFETEINSTRLAVWVQPNTRPAFYFRWRIAWLEQIEQGGY